MVPETLGTQHASAAADCPVLLVHDLVLTAQRMSARAIRKFPGTSDTGFDHDDSQSFVIRFAGSSCCPPQANGGETAASQVDSRCYGLPVYGVLASSVPAVFPSWAIHISVMTGMVQPETGCDQSGCQLPAGNMRGNVTAIPENLTVTRRADDRSRPGPALTRLPDSYASSVPYVIRCGLQCSELRSTPSILTEVMPPAQTRTQVAASALVVSNPARVEAPWRQRPCSPALLVMPSAQTSSRRCCIAVLFRTRCHNDTISHKTKKMIQAPAADSGAGQPSNNREGVRK